MLSFFGATKFATEYSLSYSLSIIIGRGVIKIGLDCYFFITFVSNFIFLVKKKSEALAAQCLTLTPFNRAILFWTLLNLLLKVVHSFSNNVLVSLYVMNADPSPRVEFAFNFMIRTMVFITDFLNAVTLLYLFYCQAEAQAK